MKPYKCPICNGHGIVPAGFYNTTTGVWISSTNTTEQCRSCLGSGILWGYDDNDYLNSLDNKSNCYGDENYGK